MSKRVKLLLAAAGALAATLAYAQRPPEVTQQGDAYLRVNINPTDVPPMVNVNPFGYIPKVEVTRLPEIPIKIPTSGCQDRQGFHTGVGKSIPGPLVVTYLNFPAQSKALLVGPGGSQPVSLQSSGQVTTAIFLQAGQRLDFDSPGLYSGCQP